MMMVLKIMMKLPFRKFKVYLGKESNSVKLRNNLKMVRKIIFIQFTSYCMNVLLTKI